MKKRLWNTTRQLNAPKMAAQVGGHLFGVHLPIFKILILKQHQIFKISYFHVFH